MTADNKQKVCFVLGQHRSGTSALTGLLKIFGADLGDDHVHEHDSWNQKGYFENKAFEEFNESILSAFNRTWSTIEWIEDFNHNSQFWHDKRLELRSLIRQQAGTSSLVVVKDPRISLFVDLYCIVAKDLEDEFDFSFIFSQRDETENVESLVKRGSLSTVDADGNSVMNNNWASMIIKLHSRSFEVKFKEAKHAFKYEYHTYSNLFYDIEKYFKHLDSSLELGLTINEETLKAANDFLSHELKHHHNHASCKVIATYFGNRRRWPSGNEQSISMWKHILKLEKKTDPGEAMDTLVVIHDHGDQDAIDYIMSLDGKPTRRGIIKTAVRPWEDGIGASFKSFDFAFKKWRDEYENWIFDEDNVFIFSDNYLSRALWQHSLPESKNVAFIGFMRCDARDFSIVNGQVVSGRLFDETERKSKDYVDIWHCHGGCGFTTKRFLDEVVKKFGSLPYSSMPKPGEPGNGLNEKHPWYRSVEQDGEVMFTAVYHLLGYKVCELDYYGPITYYKYDNSYA